MVSSAARIPFPSATSVSATLSSSWLVMRILPVLYSCGIGVALLILRAPGGNEGVAAAPSSQTKFARSVPSDRASTAGELVGEREGEDVLTEPVLGRLEPPPAHRAPPVPCQVHGHNTPNSPRHPFCPMPDKPKT